ncbi:MAG: acetate kinase, partial [Candidatus Moranbacteria bacterium]|nr:acetate kinase [Candidatus Moranbacteria bacterium]
PIKSGRLISAKEINVIRQCSQLAPLHNPFNLLGIQEAARWGQKIVQAAVFDTAFFSCLPEYAKTYAIPESLAKRYQLYRCGFHGISHSYALLEAARRLKKPARKLKAITIHLGGGASIAAIKNGKAVDTSMGFTPLEGLVMSTRSGDIDPGIIFYLLRQGFTPGKLENILVNESGIKGLANIKNMRTLVQRVRRENALVSSAPARYRAGRAFDIYVYRIRKYIGAYLAALGGCDAVLFTGAVGSGDSLTRNQVVKPLKRTILKGVPVMAIISNEEKMIAREVLKLIRRG